MTLEEVSFVNREPGSSLFVAYLVEDDVNYF